MKTHSRRQRWALAAFAVCSAALLCGADCDINIPLTDVEDAGGYWDKAGIDAQLAGKWWDLKADADDPDAGAFRFTRRGLEYELATQQQDAEGHWRWMPTYWVRTLKLGDHAFLLCKQAAGAAKNARADMLHENHIAIMFPYTVEKDTLRFHFLKPEAVAQAAKLEQWRDVISITKRPVKNPKEGEPKEKTVMRIPRLDAKTMKLIAWLAENPKNWETDDSMTFTRKPPKKDKE